MQATDGWGLPWSFFWPAMVKAGNPMSSANALRMEIPIPGFSKTQQPWERTEDDSRSPVFDGTEQRPLYDILHGALRHQDEVRPLPGWLEESIRSNARPLSARGENGRAEITGPSAGSTETSP